MSFEYFISAGLIGWIALGFVSRWGLTLIEAIVVIDIVGIYAGQYLIGKNTNWLLRGAFVALFTVLPYILIAMRIRRGFRRKKDEKKPVV